MDETVEEDVVEEIKEQIVEKPVEKVETQTIIEGGENKEKIKENIKFNDVDAVMNNHGKEEFVTAPKNIERLEEISTLRNIKRKMEEEDDDEKLTISNEDVSLDSLDVNVIDQQGGKLNDDILGLADIEILV
jgi:hypothetical protein